MYLRSSSGSPLTRLVLAETRRQGAERLCSNGSVLGTLRCSVAQDSCSAMRRAARANALRTSGSRASPSLNSR